MNDEELIAEFIRLEKEDVWQWLAVREISWKNPYTPISSWTRVVAIAADATAEEVDDVRQAVLENEHYFRICRHCKERKPVGWMTDQSCHSCAERHEGVVY